MKIMIKTIVVGMAFLPLVTFASGYVPFHVPFISWNF